MQQVTETIWELVPEETWDNAFVARDPHTTLSVYVRRDGCVDFRQDDDIVHVCDLDKFIRHLEALKQLAIARFKEWPQD